MRTDRQEALADADLDLLVLASAAELAEFEITLGGYEAATVEALLVNKSAQAECRERLSRMLAEAHVLPDGRRVFRTADGQHVYDEHGAAVSEHTISSAAISEHRPLWESYRDTVQEDRRLSAERGELLEYQEKLDRARERLDSGEMTRGELAELDKELKADMPQPVRERVAGEPSGEAAPPARDAQSASPSHAKSQQASSTFEAPSLGR